jgi:hypothetical protein
LVPCPDDRGSITVNGNVTQISDSGDYWGDYDDMFFNSATCTFIRPFTDSSLGCVSRTAFGAQHQHVSAVEIPCEDPESFRKVTVDYHLFVNDDDFGDPDECGTWGFSRSGCSTHNALHAECTVNPASLVSDAQIFKTCVDDEVTGTGRMKCELLPDLRTVRVTLTSIVEEGTSCNDDEVARVSKSFDVGAGLTVGDDNVLAEAKFEPTNGSPYDRTEIILPTNAIANTVGF